MIMSFVTGIYWYIIRMVKSGHVARTGRREMHVGYWWESQRAKDH
jgi:hypothetical protein